MTTPTSGTISIGDVRTAMAGSGAASLNNMDVRWLAGISSGTISLSDLYSKQTYTAKSLGIINATTLNVAWQGTGSPSGWPDASSCWLTVQSGTASSAPVTTTNFEVYYNNDTGIAKTATIWFAADDVLVVYVNDVQVSTLKGWETPTSVTATINAGVNRIAAQLTNTGGPSINTCIS